MFYSNDRNKMRQFYLDAWNKHQQQQILTPLEQQIVEVIIQHPEYHVLLAGNLHDQDYRQVLGQTNPFMHMGLHLAIRDQITLDQPTGIKPLYQSQLAKGQTQHAIEHAFMDVLGEHLWRATAFNSPLNMQAYLEDLQKLKKI